MDSGDDNPAPGPSSTVTKRNKVRGDVDDKMIIGNIDMNPPFFGKPERKARSGSRSRFDKTTNRVPVRAIVRACLYFVAGTLLLILGMLLLADVFPIKYRDRIGPIIILGLLLFIPGVFHTRIVYLAYVETPGYSYEDISKFE